MGVSEVHIYTHMNAFTECSRLKLEFYQLNHILSLYPIVCWYHVSNCISTYILHTSMCIYVHINATTLLIVRCVGGSKAPPVLHSSYRTDFERDCAV